MEEKLAQIEEDYSIPPADILTVSELNDHINDLFEAAPDIASIHLLGEVSNLSRSSNDHLFLDLKDADARVSCVMFNDTTEQLEYELKDGDEILVRGTAEYYEKQGNTSFKIKDVYPVGEGKYYAEIRKRMKKLEKEGLFDTTHKKEVPLLPETVGLVTSKESAAVQDMVNAIHDHYPDVDIYVKHATVQGKHAVDDLTKGLTFFDEEFDVDVIVVGRGGGSIEDLQAFNSEAFARAVFDCDTPVVSGVGHRTDETITGYVTDHGAITPTAAGKYVVERKEVLERELDELEDRVRDTYKEFKEKEEQKKELSAALTRERAYQLTIAVQLLIIAVLLGVILL